MPDVSAAAADNAAWCDLVCRAAGLPTASSPWLWSSPRRSPDAYPDAVTLAPGASPTAVLTAIDDGPGASVKDSFADLDLAPHGYAVLFEATWISREPSSASPALAWQVVDAPLLPRWLAAHGSRAIRPAVLDDPTVRLLLASDEDGPVAVAALNRSGEGPATVIGVSNVHVVRADAELVWSDVAALARRELGPHPLVGYESGADLAAPSAVGFEALGRLRVWLR